MGRRRKSRGERRRRSRHNSPLLLLPLFLLLLHRLLVSLALHVTPSSSSSSVFPEKSYATRQKMRGKGSVRGKCRAEKKEARKGFLAASARRIEQRGEKTSCPGSDVFLHIIENNTYKSVFSSVHKAYFFQFQLFIPRAPNLMK